MEALNSPIAVIAILAGVAVLIREVAWFIKTTNLESQATYEGHWFYGHTQ